MTRNSLAAVLLSGTVLASGASAWAGQAPAAASAPDIPVSHQDRVYAAEQFSNTVSVTDPADNTLLGVIRLGQPQPANFSPLYYGQVLVHGMGFSPDHRTIVVVSIGSNSVSFVDTATNTVKHTTYVGRSPHEAFFSPDGAEVWVTVRGENYVSALDATTYTEKTRITTPNGPGMQIFSPDGMYGYVCSSFTPETKIVSVAGLNQVKVFRTADFSLVATIPVGKLPHGVWPSGDGSRVYVGLENNDLLTAIDTLTNKVIATVPIGQAAQAVVYVPNAVPDGDGTQGLQPLGAAGQAAHISMAPAGRKTAAGAQAPTSVTLFDQGLIEVLEAAVTGLEPMQPYVLALASRADGGGELEPLQDFMTNPAGAAIVNTVGPILEIVKGETAPPRRYLVIASGSSTNPGTPVQIQVP